MPQQPLNATRVLWSMPPEQPISSAPLCEVCGNEAAPRSLRCTAHINMALCHSCHAYVDADTTIRSRNMVICNPCLNTVGRACYLCKKPVWHLTQVTHRRWPICDKCRTGWNQCRDCGTLFPEKDLITEAKVFYCAFCHGRRSRLLDVPISTFRSGSTRLFGYELEFIHPPANIDKLFALGQLKSDGSVRNSIGSGFDSYEFASPPVSGDGGFEHIDRVCAALAKGVVNDSCGFHTHLSIERSSTEQRANIQFWWQCLETLFFAYVPPHRWSNNYCRPCREISTVEWARNRYMSLNIAAASKWGTFECRLHEGTLRPQDIKMWITILLRFFDTFQNIEATSIRLRKVRHLSDRERLQFLFHQMKLPLSARQHFIRRVKQPASPFIELHKIGKKGAYLNV